jgi:hypothetical protein
VAGSPWAQTVGSELERVQEDAAAQRIADSDQKAESAAGVGATDGENHETAPRESNSRGFWETPADDQAAEAAEDRLDSTLQRRSQDATGQSGNLLDLSG